MTEYRSEKSKMTDARLDCMMVSEDSHYENWDIADTCDLLRSRFLRVKET